MKHAALDSELLKAIDAMEAQGYRPVLIAFVNDEDAVQTLVTDEIDVRAFLRFLADETTGESRDVESSH
jgi:hypothetical protein